MLAKTNVEPIKKAIVAIKEMDADEELRELAFQRETALRDRASALRFSREEGLREGKEEGLKEGRMNSVRSIMKSLGLTADKALAAAGIPEDQWKDYLSELT